MWTFLFGCRRIVLPSLGPYLVSQEAAQNSVIKASEQPKLQNTGNFVMILSLGANIH